MRQHVGTQHTATQTGGAARMPHRAPCDVAMVEQELFYPTSYLRPYGIVLLLLAAMGLLTACSMMEEDRDDCPDGLYVGFTYDYNVDRADMFRDQVGAVTLYVYDAADHLVTTCDISRPAVEQPIATVHTHADTRYQLHLPLPAGRYRLVAVAQQRPYDELLSRPGAKFRRSAAAPDAPSDLWWILDREAAEYSESSELSERSDASEDAPLHAVPHGGVPLDTLWVGHARQYVIPDTAMTDGTIVATDDYVEVVDQRPTYALVSLIRDTNELHVSLRAADADADHPVRADDYAVTIIDRNGRIAWDNTVLADDRLVYTPYAQRTVITVGSGGDTDGATGDAGIGTASVEQAAHFDFSFPRLMYSERADENALMRIVHKPTGHVVAELNLTHLLAQGRSYPLFTRYSDQEFLDREHRFGLELVVLGDDASQRLAYISLSISVLNWAKRIQYENL